MGSRTLRGQTVHYEGNQDLPDIEELPVRAEIIGKHLYSSIALEAREFLCGGTSYVEQQGLDQLKAYPDVAFERE